MTHSVVPGFHSWELHNISQIHRQCFRAKSNPSLSCLIFYFPQWVETKLTHKGLVKMAWKNVFEGKEIWKKISLGMEVCYNFRGSTSLQIFSPHLLLVFFISLRSVVSNFLLSVKTSSRQPFYERILSWSYHFLWAVLILCDLRVYSGLHTTFLYNCRLQGDHRNMGTHSWKGLQGSLKKGIHN